MALVTIRQLEIFSKVAATGSVTKAGDALLLTQSAVSMALAQLEQQSVSPLFERRGRRLMLNDAGRILLKETEEVLARVGRLERQLLGTGDDAMEGELLVGGSTTIGNYLLPGILGAFARRYPQTRVELQVGNTRQVAELLEAGRLDVAFTEGPCHQRSLTAIPWRDDELVVIAGKDHPWSREKAVTADQLATGFWIMRERGSGTREVFEDAMEATGIAYTIALEFGHTEAIKNGVASGLGVSCLSRIAVRRELEYGLLVEVAGPLKLKRSLSLLKRRSGCCTPLLSAFLQVADGRWNP